MFLIIGEKDGYCILVMRKYLQLAAIRNITGHAKRDLAKKNVDNNDYFVNLKNN